MDNSDVTSNMSCFEKIKRNPLYYFLKFCLLLIIITIIFFIEKFLYYILHLITYFWFISVIFQIILHLLLIRYLVLQVAFAGLCFLINRQIQYRNGKREAVFIYNELSTIKSAIGAIFDNQKPVQELKHLNTIQRNIKSANSVIKSYYKVFSKMKTKFGELTFDQNIFYENLTNLYESFEQSEIIKLLDDIIKQLRAEKIFSIKNLSFEEKERINKEKIEKKKYIGNINSSIELLINQIRDYIGEDYCIFSPRFIRNFFKNYLFCSIQQFHIELDNYFDFEEKKLKTKDGNTLEYIIIKNNKKNNNYDKKLIIICGPNGEPYQVFSRNILLNKYLSQGIDVLCWNYRGYGFSTGKATFNNLKSDVIEIYEEIEKMKIYNKIGVQGISIGGLPSCYLAKQKNNISLLVSDRNFGQIDSIAKNYSFGKYLVILYKFLLISSSRTVENYMESNVYKIILNDPNDEIVTEEGSLKTLLSEEFCSKYLELNEQDYSSISVYTNKDTTIELETLDDSNNESLNLNDNIKQKNNNSKNNLIKNIIVSSSLNAYKLKKMKNKSALDVILSEDKKSFINCLINICEALKNEKLNINKNSICNKISKKFIKSKIEDDKYSNLKEEEFQNSVGLRDFIKDKMSSCFEIFKSAGDNLNKLMIKTSRYNQNLFIENFFNNLFIWGTYDKRDDYGSVYHSTEYIDGMLSKVIDSLNLFLNSQEIISYKNINIIKDIEDFYNFLIKIKNNIKYLGIRNENNFIFLSNGNNYEKELLKLGRGHFVWLSCGHNGLPSTEENIVFKHYLRESLLFKNEEKNINNNKSQSQENNYNNIKENNFSDSNLEELDTSVSILTKSLED